MNGVPLGQDGRPTQNRQLGIEGCVVCAISVLRAWQVQSALDKNRTRQQKGLRDRNSPTCTLSQNGYGDSSIVALPHALCHEECDRMSRCTIMYETWGAYLAEQKIKMQNGDTGSPHRGHCILFRAVVSALPAAPTFPCSVASLRRFAGYHAPGLLSLRRGALAHRRLARGSSSVQFARRAWVYQHSHPTIRPTKASQSYDLLYP